MLRPVTTILAVDDEPKILETVRAYLERDGFRVLCASGGREAEKLLEENPVGLVLLDLMLPGLSGEEICKRIRGAYYGGADSAIPIIMITAKVDEASIIRGLNMGADDYVTKPFSPRELAARVGALLRRSGAGVRGETFTAGDIVIDAENRRVTRGGQSIKLTSNEFKIFSLLASRPHKIFTRDEIIDSLSDDFDGFDRAVDNHIKNLRQKLGDNPRTPRYIDTVYGMGYRIHGDNA